jgi:hypothetical protein
MRIMKSIALAAVCSWGAWTAAHAGVAGTIGVTIAPIQNNATYSSVGPPALNSVVGYQVTVQNTGKNTNNNVVFHAAVGATDNAEAVSFNSSEGAVCTSEPPITNDATQIGIACALGTLSSGQSSPTFFIFFNTPLQVINGTADVAGTDFVSLSYQVTYAEGKNGPNSKPSNGFTTPVSATPVALGTSNPQLVRSVVLASGGTFFTGDGGNASAPNNDPHATTTIVPALTTHTTVDISETPIAGDSLTPCTGNVVTCFVSSIAIPGSFPGPFLSVRLSEVIQNILVVKTCVKVATGDHDGDDDDFKLVCTFKPVPIEQISVVYFGDGVPVTTTGGLVLQTCNPTPVDAATPCISSRQVILDGGGNPIRYEWTLLGRHNGSWGVR